MSQGELIITSSKNKAAVKPVSMLGPIFGAHIKRIGVIRTIAGALAMYSSIPLFIICHTTVAVIFYQWLLRPILRTKRVRWKDYIIIDRYRIEGLTWYDKFNCMFCGYANGLTTMLNIEFDNASRAALPLPFWKKTLLLILFILMFPIYIILELSIQVIYNILVSRPLGMHRISMREAREMLIRYNYAGEQWAVIRIFLRTFKSWAFRLAMGLEQIESSWCPLRHFENRKGVVYPTHHDKFFGPNEIEEMHRVLSTRGTVSDRLPKW